MTPGDISKHDEARYWVDLSQIPDSPATMWLLANNNRKRVEGLERAVAALTVLVIVVFLITLALTVAIVWRVI